MEKDPIKSTQSTNERSKSSVKSASLSVEKRNSLESSSNFSKVNKGKFSIPHGSFKRLAVSLTPDFKWKKSALESLHYAAEAYIKTLFEDTNLILTHCKRKTLFVKDLTLAKRIRGEN
jgi:histone H3/H4